MRTETIIKTFLTYEECDEKQKEKLIDKYRDVNIDHDWWDFTYEDAKTIGAKISGFDLDRGNKIDFEFVDHALSVANAILANHGEVCETYKLAEEFKKAYDKAEADESVDDLITEFERAIGEDYLSSLKKDYEYFTSDEAVIETIQSNGYELEIT